MLTISISIRSTLNSPKAHPLATYTPLKAMLVIRKTKNCFYGSFPCDQDGRHKCSSIPSIRSKFLPLISTCLRHASSKEAQPQLEMEAEEAPVEEPPVETLEEVPEVSERELEDASIRGLREPDRNNCLALITEMLGAEVCDGEMVTELSEAVKEWSWTYKRQRQRAIETEMLAQRRLPPPVSWYAGRPCRFLKVERSNGRIIMTQVEMIWPPEVMQVAREDGRVRMELMTYVGDTSDETISEEAEEEEEEEVTDMWDRRVEKAPVVTAA